MDNVWMPPCSGMYWLLEWPLAGLKSDLPKGSTGRNGRQSYCLFFWLGQ